MADFAELEEADGVRLTWNVWPASKVEAAKCVVPFAALYTPAKPLPNMPVREGEGERGGGGWRKRGGDRGARRVFPTPPPPPSLPFPQIVQYDPVPCKQCGAILNPYAGVDFGARAWACALCGARNAFPAHYAGVSEQVREKKGGGEGRGAIGEREREAGGGAQGGGCGGDPACFAFFR